MTKDRCPLVERLQILLLAQLLLGQASCVGPRADRSGPLPFHVAVLPVTVQRSARESEEMHDGEMQLSFDPRDVEENLATVLGRECFARVSVLPVQEQNTEVEQVASAQGADLLLSCSITYDPVVSSALNEKFWLSLPLFLLGGPITYFFDDRTYFADVNVSARLTDIHAVLAGRASLDDGRAEYGYYEYHLDRTTLDFLDRRPGAGSFALSLLVPVGLLATEGVTVEEALALSLARDLGGHLAEEILRRRDDLSQSGRVADFFLDPEVLVERKEGTRVLRGRVLLRRDSPSELDRCQVSIGGEATTVPLRQNSSTPSSRFVPYLFEAPLSEDARQARIAILTGGRDLQVRTYTVNLPE